MQNNGKNVCRCCLKLVHSANVGFINEVMEKNLSLLLIKLDLDVSDHRLVCDTCAEVLDEIISFKSKCLLSEDIIITQMEINSKVSLRDILIEIENKRNIDIGEDEVVCRLCIKIPLNGSYLPLGETGDGIFFIRDMILIHLPEMDLNISEKPIICEVCLAQLKNYVFFATNCIAVEKKIKLYCDLRKISGRVDLACVLQFMEDKALDLQNRLNEDLVIKQEDDSVMVKVETVQDAETYIAEDHFVDCGSSSKFYFKDEDFGIKSESDEMREEMEGTTMTPYNSGKSGCLKRKGQIMKFPSKGAKHLSSEDHMARHRGRSMRFCCRECTFKGHINCNLTRHMDKHKDKSELQMCKCENCEFETKWKASLTPHMLTHRDTKAERKFKCDQCPYETVFKDSICKHNLIHKDKAEVEMYKCENCGHETKRKDNLIKHMLTHRDPKADRKFKCDKCSYETNFKNALHSHNLIHKDKSEVEMYKCEICEFETRYKHYIKAHMVNHRVTKAEKKI